MVAKIQRYDLTNVSEAAAIAAGITFVDGFADNCVFSKFHPDIFGAQPTLQEPELTRRKAQVGTIRGKALYRDVLSGTQMFFNLVEEGEVKATAWYNLPEPLQIKLTWTQWARYQLYRAWHWIDCHIINRSLMKEYYWMPEQVEFANLMHGTGLTPEQEEEHMEVLSTSSYEELADLRYPEDDTLYLRILCASKTQGQGRGFGSRVLNESLAYFKPGETTFTTSKGTATGPAKVSLVPTEGNESFYQKYGFKTVHERKIENNYASCVSKVMDKVIA